MDGGFARFLEAVFSHPDWGGALVIAAKTAVVYIFVVAGLRLLGKRELGQMSIYDLVLIVVLANAVQNAMVGKDNSLGGGLVAALTLLLLNRALTWLVIHQAWFSRQMVGEPVLIVKDGHLLRRRMEREGLTREHVLAAMREHGIGELEQVQMAVLEVDGSVSIVSHEGRVQRTHRRFKGLRLS